MNRAQFGELIQAFLARARSGRHLYIWYGEEQTLLDMLPRTHTDRLEISGLLAELTDAASADDEARRQLSRLIRTKLEEMFSDAATGPRIVVVSGTVLLARYGIASVFFEFVNDRRMIILQTNPRLCDPETIEHLPDYTHFKPMIELDILRPLLERPEYLVTEE